MLIAGLILIAVVEGMWLTYMVQYPAKWAARVERHYRILFSVGINAPWMYRIERGPVMKVLLGLAIFVTLACIAILIRHPTALQDFLQESTGPHGD